MRPDTRQNFMAHYLTPISLLCIVLLLASGCADPPNKGGAPPDLEVDSNDVGAFEPNFVTVQHCLISFKGSKTSKDTVTRTEAEAKQLAMELFEKAKNGADFDEMVKKHTDDAAPGIYRMANFGIQGDQNPARDVADQLFERQEIASAFGSVGFSLEVGEIGMTSYDKTASPFGYHIIKRVK